jgi:hypothetical protein
MVWTYGSLENYHGCLSREPVNFDEAGMALDLPSRFCQCSRSQMAVIDKARVSDRPNRSSGSA